MKAKCSKCGQPIRGQMDRMCDKCHSLAVAKMNERHAVGCASCDAEFEESEYWDDAPVNNPNSAGGGRRVIRKSTPFS